MTKKELKATIAELTTAVAARDQAIDKLREALRKTHHLGAVSEATLLFHVRLHAGNVAELQARIAVERKVKDAESGTCVTMTTETGVVN